MNPMQRFMPGIGQPIDFAAMAAGQGIGGGNPLAEALAGSRQQNTLASAPTLGNPQAQSAQQADLAAMMEAYKQAQGQQQMGDYMSQPEYVQNSGALGALAMIAQSAAGRKVRREGDEKASDYASRIFAEEQRMSQAQAEAQAKAEEAKLARTWAREDQRDESKAQREERLAMMRIEAADRRAAQSAEARIRAAQIGAGGQRQDRNPIADKIANAEAALGRPLNDAERSALAGVPAASQEDKPLGAEAATKVALLENSYRPAQKWVGNVVSRAEDGTPTFNRIEAMKPGNRALLTQALRAKLRAESGATITEEEIAGETDRYMAGLFSSDATGAQKAEALLSDLETQIGAFGPQGQRTVDRLRTPAAPASGGIDALLDKYK